MSQNTFRSNQPENFPPKLPEQTSDPKSREVEDLLRAVKSLLDDNQPDKALDVIRKSKASSIWTRNAAGVCHLRLGNAKVAVEIYRGLVLRSDSVLLRSDIPAVFKTNFAIALLNSDNIAGCINVLSYISETDHPSVPRIRSAIDQWRNRLTLWQRFIWLTGVQPEVPISICFPPGDLE